MRKSIWVFLIVFCLTNYSYSGAFDGVGMGAKPMGMGETFTAVGEDIYSVFYNPAGLAKADKPSALFSYRDFYSLGLLTQKYIGISIPGKFINTGFSWHRVGTTGAVKFIDYNEDIYILTLAGESGILKDLLLGANLKFYRVSSKSNASGYGIDLGALYPLFNEKLLLGLFMKDLNEPEIIWDTGATDNLNFVLRTGVGIKPVKNLTVAIDFVGAGRINTGVELWLFNNKIGLRGGVKNITDKNISLSLGTSFGLNGLQFDYALSRHDALGYSHFFSLLIIKTN